MYPDNFWERGADNLQWASCEAEISSKASESGARRRGDDDASRRFAAPMSRSKFSQEVKCARIKGAGINADSQPDDKAKNEKEKCRERKKALHFAVLLGARGLPQFANTGASLLRSATTGRSLPLPPRCFRAPHALGVGPPHKRAGGWPEPCAPKAQTGTTQGQPGPPTNRRFGGGGVATRGNRP